MFFLNSAPCAAARSATANTRWPQHVAIALALFVAWQVRSSAADEPAITALARAPADAGFVLGSQAGVFLRPHQAAPSRAVATELDNVHCLRFSPDAQSLAVAGGTAGEAGTIEIWSWPMPAMTRQLDGHGDLVYDCVWLADSTRLASASADRTIRVWDVRSGQTVATLSGHSGPVLALALSPDGRLLCSGSADHTIRVWDTRCWELVRTLPNHLGAVHALGFRSPGTWEDGTPRAAYLASAAEDHTVRIWQPEIGRMVRIVRHSTAVLALQWTAAGSLLSGSKDGVVHAIDADRGVIERAKETRGGWVMSLAVAESGRTAAGDSRGQLHMLDW